LSDERSDCTVVAEQRFRVCGVCSAAREQLDVDAVSRLCRCESVQRVAVDVFQQAGGEFRRDGGPGRLAARIVVAGGGDVPQPELGSLVVAEMVSVDGQLAPALEAWLPSDTYVPEDEEGP